MIIGRLPAIKGLLSKGPSIRLLPQTPERRGRNPLPRRCEDAAAGLASTDDASAAAWLDAEVGRRHDPALPAKSRYDSLHFLKQYLARTIPGLEGEPERPRSELSVTG